MQDLQFFDLIFLGMIALFIILRLRSVLGTRTGNERPPEELKKPLPGPAAGQRDGVVVPLPRRAALEAPLSPAEITLRQALTEISLADGQFDANEFAEGARQAYEMIITGFAKGDRELLRNMVGDEVYANFDAAITERETAGESMDTRLAAISEARITHAVLRGKIAEVTVKFTADLISCVRNAAGEVIQGHPSLPQQVMEFWTFSRDTGSSDPNWTLIASAPDAPDMVSKD